MAEHKMVSLKRKPSEHDGNLLEPREENLFPLTLYIDEIEIEKLDIGNLKIGEMHELRANVKVTSVSVNEHTGNKKHEKHRSITLTLIEAEVNSDHRANQAETLFGPRKNKEKLGV